MEIEREPAPPPRALSIPLITAKHAQRTWHCTLGKHGLGGKTQVVPEGHRWRAFSAAAHPSTSRHAVSPEPPNPFGHFPQTDACPSGPALQVVCGSQPPLLTEQGVVTGAQPVRPVPR